MRRRIFIAANLPEKIKKQLHDQQYKWLELPCRWTRVENLHITLAFLGYINDEELPEICQITKEIALKHEPFSLKLNRIAYGPEEKNPRMVWVGGEKSEELGKLQKDLENALVLSPEIQKEMKENRSFSPHITLGRLKQFEFRAIEPEERPQINEEINLIFEVNSIEIMESNLKKHGPEYSIMESFPLNK